MTTNVHDELAARQLDALSVSAPGMARALGGPFSHVSGVHVAAICKAASDAIERGVNSDEIVHALRALQSARMSGEWPVQEE